jgi:hypothetical protein
MIYQPIASPESFWLWRELKKMQIVSILSFAAWANLLDFFKPCITFSESTTF